MGARLHNDGTVGTILASELKDGAIAVITCWNHKQYIGRVVQRVDENMIGIGAPFGSRWDFPDDLPATCRVRILQPGELIEVT